jgi:hypothetical protein
VNQPPVNMSNESLYSLHESINNQVCMNKKKDKAINVLKSEVKFLKDKMQNEAKKKKRKINKLETAIK